MSSITSLAAQYARQLFNWQLDAVRAETSVAPEGLNAVRQTPVPAVLAKRYADGYEQQRPQVAKPVWGQLPDESSSEPAARVAMKLFRDGFETARPAPVDLKGGASYPAGSTATTTASISESLSKVEAGSFSASYDDLPQLA